MSQGPTLVTKLEWHRAAKPKLPYILAPLYPRLRRSFGARGECGIYFLLSSQRIVYIGQSRNVAARVKEHRRHPPAAFDDFWYIPVPRACLDAYETALIVLLRPIGNGYVAAGHVATPRRWCPEYHLALIDFLGPLALSGVERRSMASDYELEEATA